jgi:hypothetical protein
VTAIRDADGERLVAVEIWADDDKGERLAVGRAEVALPL